MIDVGITHLPTDPAVAADLAQTADEVGIGWFGVADSPRIYGAMYPAIQHALSATSAMRIGPLVTNPVTRHSSVHGADLAALDSLHPGRVFAAFGTGDSAVRSAGARAATPGELAIAVEDVRSMTPARVPILFAASGLRVARHCPTAADGILLGAGLEPDWLEQIASTAEASAGKPLQRWIVLLSHLVAGAADYADARAVVRASIVSFSRHALAGDKAAKGVPAEFVDGLAELSERYVFTEHAKIGSANARLLEEYPQLEDYLLNRFGAVGTAAETASRVQDVAGRTRIDGVFLTANVPDRAAHIRLIGSELVPLLAG